MKKTWVRPKGSIENFVPNEYINSCMEIKLECAIPGKSAYYVNDGTIARTDSDGLDHGICGNWSTTFISSSSASGYETENGKVAYNRPISNVTLGGTIANLTSSTYFDDSLNGSTSLDSATTGTYYATWQSTDGHNTYTHYGVATVTAIDSTRPNHS